MTPWRTCSLWGLILAILLAPAVCCCLAKGAAVEATVQPASHHDLPACHQTSDRPADHQPPGDDCDCHATIKIGIDVTGKLAGPHGDLGSTPLVATVTHDGTVATDRMTQRLSRSDCEPPPDPGPERLVRFGIFLC